MERTPPHDRPDAHRQQPAGGQPRRDGAGTRRLSAVRVVHGKQLAALGAEELASLRDAASRVVVDVGAGDARAAYRLAAARPGWLVVGLDPAWARMVPTSVRAARKPARGGLRNLVLAVGTAEHPPAELDGAADEVLVLMPWGSLLRGVVEGRDDVCVGLRRLAGTGATLEVTVGTSIWREPVPREVRDLPELTPEHVDGVLAGRLAAHGWRLTARSWVSSTDLADARAAAAAATRADGPDDQERGPAPSPALSSSWARRLGSGEPEQVARLTATAVAVPATGPHRPSGAT